VRDLPTRRYTRRRGGGGGDASAGERQASPPPTLHALVINADGADDDAPAAAAAPAEVVAMEEPVTDRPLPPQPRPAVSPAAGALDVDAWSIRTDRDVCPICLDDYQDDDLLRILPCKHEFHAACVDQWLIHRKRYCPLCKYDVFPDERSPLI